MRIENSFLLVEGRRQFYGILYIVKRYRLYMVIRSIGEGGDRRQHVIGGAFLAGAAHNRGSMATASKNAVRERERQGYHASFLLLHPTSFSSSTPHQRFFFFFLLHSTSTPTICLLPPLLLLLFTSEKYGRSKLQLRVYIYIKENAQKTPSFRAARQAGNIESIQAYFLPGWRAHRKQESLAWHIHIHRPKMPWHRQSINE